MNLKIIIFARKLNDLEPKPKKLLKLGLELDTVSMLRINTKLLKYFLKQQVTYHSITNMKKDFLGLWGSNIDIRETRSFKS